MFDGDRGEETDLVLPRFVRLVVVQVAGVVAELVDVGRDAAGETVIFLQVDDQVGRGLAADFGQGVGVASAVDGDADHVGPGGDEVVHLGDRGVNVLRVRGRHALHGDGLAGANRGGTDADGAGGIAWDQGGRSEW